MSDAERVIVEAGLVVSDALEARFRDLRVEFAANVEARMRVTSGSGDWSELPALLEQRDLIGRELNAAFKALREMAP